MVSLAIYSLRVNCLDSDRTTPLPKKLRVYFVAIDLRLQLGLLLEESGSESVVIPIYEVVFWDLRIDEIYYDDPRV